MGNHTARYSGRIHEATAKKKKSNLRDNDNEQDGPKFG